MKATLPFVAALSPLAAEQGFDLTKLALAEMEFDRKARELREWLESTKRRAA